MSTACTQKNAVGALCQCSPSHARSSSTIALAKRGQITMLNTPAAMRNRAPSLEITPPSHHRSPDARAAARRSDTVHDAISVSCAFDGNGVMKKFRAAVEAGDFAAIGDLL